MHLVSAQKVKQNKTCGSSAFLKAHLALISHPFVLDNVVSAFTCHVMLKSTANCRCYTEAKYFGHVLVVWSRFTVKLPLLSASFWTTAGRCRMA